MVSLGGVRFGIVFFSVQVQSRRWVWLSGGVLPVRSGSAAPGALGYVLVAVVLVLCFGVRGCGRSRSVWLVHFWLFWRLEVVQA